MPTLTISATSATIESTPLALKPQYLEVLQLAALRQLEGNPDLTTLEVAALPHWHNKQAASIAPLLLKQHKIWQAALGIPLFVGSFYKVFRLNPDITPIFTQPLEQVRQDFAPKPSIVRLENRDAEAQSQLILGKIHIERGKLEAAISAFHAALEVEPSTIIKQETLFYLARAYEFQSEFGLAEKTLHRLHKCLEYHEREGNPTESVAYAWHSIGCARIHIRHSRWAEAKALYNKAKSILAAQPHRHRELGMVHNGLGRVYQNSPAPEGTPQTRLTDLLEVNLSHALREYETALHHYHLDTWHWAAQASLNDLGVVYKEKCKLIWRHQNPQAQRHLAQALRYFTLCHQICQAENTGDESAVVEINLGWAHRLYGQPDTARVWLEQALHLASQAGNKSDLGWGLCEFAELEWQLGNRNAAIEKLETAKEVFDSVGLLDAGNVALRRLLEVRHQPSAKPVHGDG
jgi:tetratricopeptide (TPR) repeat protein